MTNTDHLDFAPRKKMLISVGTVDNFESISISSYWHIVVDFGSWSISNISHLWAWVQSNAPSDLEVEMSEAWFPRFHDNNDLVFFYQIHWPQTLNQKFGDVVIAGSSSVGSCWKMQIPKGAMPVF